jgi:hypothetical protein
MALVNCRGNNPRVISTWMILQPQPPFVPDASGHVAGSVIGNDKIDCGGTPTVPVITTLYAVSYFVNNVQSGPTKMFSVLAGTTFDPTTATPSNAGPVPPPSWNSTYIRLNGASPGHQATNGQVPVYNAADGVYEPGAVRKDLVRRRAGDRHHFTPMSRSVACLIA